MSSVPTLVLKQRRKVEKVINKKKVIIMTTKMLFHVQEKLYVSQTYIGIIGTGSWLPVKCKVMILSWVTGYWT